MLKIFVKFPGKLQGLGKERLHSKCFPVNLAKFFRVTFLKIQKFSKSYSQYYFQERPDFRDYIVTYVSFNSFPANVSILCPLKTRENKNLLMF